MFEKNFFEKSLESSTSDLISIVEEDADRASGKVAM